MRFITIAIVCVIWTVAFPAHPATGFSDAASPIQAFGEFSASGPARLAASTMPIRGIAPTGGPRSRIASGLPEAEQTGSKSRDGALSALRAVESAIDGGADVNDFKKYHLDAKIKVDALPDTTQNKPLRRISQIYTDALKLMNAARTNSLSASQVAYFKTQYKDLGSEAITKLPDAGLTETSSPSARTVAEKLARIDADEARQLGIAYARHAAADLCGLAKKQLAALRK